MAVTIKEERIKSLLEEYDYEVNMYEGRGLEAGLNDTDFSLMKRGYKFVGVGCIVGKFRVYCDNKITISLEEAGIFLGELIEAITILKFIECIAPERVTK